MVSKEVRQIEACKDPSKKALGKAGAFPALTRKMNKIGGEGTLQNNTQNGKTDEVYKRFLCPVCGKHTVLWLLPTTEVKDLPIKCKRCGKESVINIMLEPAPFEPAPCVE